MVNKHKQTKKGSEGSEDLRNSCCNNKYKSNDSTGWKSGLLYGLIPHIGCIAFIIGSILGVTVLMQFFKPLLMNRYFFHFLIALSLVFATLSSTLYLKKQNLMSWAGAKKKWKYLFGMYGSTVGINLVLFMFIFPLLANFSVADSLSGSAVLNNGFDNSNNFVELNIAVDIPCPGHAPLISNELKTIEGVYGVEFSFPNKFAVNYNSDQTSKSEMLSLEVFDEYPATVLSESQSNSQVKSQVKSQTTSQSSCTGSCGGSMGSSESSCSSCSGGSNEGSGGCGGSCDGCGFS
ncbi:hypothetical protein HOK51_07215 [Candidatus Woesearchaeota archaeon]|jgi:hypothetical protein|nr:hypothetical protein [Candidatus Woesearchaeota archaeon]MBT6519611.1 hypothetical protein [Candidatus Woesearchaeota archaeon]MBT7367526.1 hypothetical protein [Candidatus Woesearchaeota archaeon]